MSGKLRLLFTLTCLLPAMAAACEADPPVDLVHGKWAWVTPAPADGRETIVQDEASPTPDRAVVRIAINSAVNPFYRMMLSHSIAAAVPEGTLIEFRVWARSRTLNPMLAVIEQAAPPYIHSLSVKLNLTAEWRQYQYNTRSPGYGPNTAAVRLQVGFQPGEIEVAGLSVQSLGMDPQFLSDRNAIEPAQIAARIEKFRKGDLDIRVVTTTGAPCAGVKVHVAMLRHRFLFGCNLFGLNTNDTSAGQMAYRKRFSDLFNYATLPFYWGAFEPAPGISRWERLDSMAQWCAGHGIVPKGHPLIWHQVYPSWAPSDADAAIPLLHQRVTDIVGHYAASIHYWDVVNEANGAGGSRPQNGESRWIERDGPASVVGTALTWARASISSHAETYIYNDYNTGQANVELLTQLRDSHRLPDAIGIQSHMHAGPWPLDQVWKVYRTFAQFGVPIHFTEITVISGPRRTVDFSAPYAADWLTTADGEKPQAEYVEKFYSLLFSCPSLRAITWWDLSDKGAWLGAPAGLLRKDMTPKPAYEKLYDLIRHAWWTDTVAKTDGRGECRARAFYGDYEITATDSRGKLVSASVTMPEGSSGKQITLTIE